MDIKSRSCKELNRNSAEWFERVLNSVSDLVLIKGPKSRLLWANKAFLDYYGMTNEQLRDLVDGPQSDPDDTVQYVKDDHYVYTTGETLDIPAEAVTDSQGNIKYFHTVKSAVVNNTGNIDMTVGISRELKDHSGLKQASLQRQNRKQDITYIKRFVTNLPSPVIMLDLNNRIISCSREWVKLFGESLNKLTGRFFDEIYSNNMFLARGIERCKRDRKYIDIEKHDFRNRDGRELIIEGRASTWEYSGGETGGVILKIQDLTQQEKAQKEIRLLHERLSLALKFSKIGVWDWDVPNNRLIWDDQMYALYGRPAEIKTEAYELWTTSLHPDDRVRGDHEIQDALEGRKSFDTEFRVIWPDGQERVIKALASVIRDDSGNPIRMLGVNVDVTEERTIKEALNKSNERFELVVEAGGIGIWEWLLGQGDQAHWSQMHYKMLGYKKGEITPSFETVQKMTHPEDIEHLKATLNKHLEENKPFKTECRLKHKNGQYRWFYTTGQVKRDTDGNPTVMIGSLQDIHEQKMAAEALKHKNEELTQFAYRTSHDLKAPLLTILGLSKLAKEDLEEKDYEEVNSSLCRINKSALKLEAFISDILSLSQIDHIKEPMEAIKVNEALDETMEKLWFLMEKGQVCIERDLKLKTLKTQKTRLGLILENLISNSIKYKDPNRQAFVKVSSKDSENNIILTIEDNGVGIEERHQPKVFDMFTRFHDGQSFGSGLGMYLVKKNIDKLGGKIELISSREGTNWTITLPKYKD